MATFAIARTYCSLEWLVDPRYVREYQAGQNNERRWARNGRLRRSCDKPRDPKDERYSVAREDCAESVLNRIGIVEAVHELSAAA